VDTSSSLLMTIAAATPFEWLAGLSFRGKVFTFACTVFVIELAFRRFAPKSKAYARWTWTFQTIGKFWTAVILGVIYFVSVAMVAIGMKLFGKDPLDRSLEAEPSFWRAHEPNPLEPHAAARHQF
jgi:hypothetical protein